MSENQRWDWLDAARDRHFALPQPWPQSPAGLVFSLRGQQITDLAAFFCAMGEAVNGPGGYFGLNLDAFDDCCVGGFGATPPFSVRWLDSEVSRSHLGHRAMLAWAEAELRRTMLALAETDSPPIGATEDGSLIISAGRHLGEKDTLREILEAERAWWEESRGQAERGVGPDLFDTLLDTMRARGVEVRLE